MKRKFNIHTHGLLDPFSHATSIVSPIDSTNIYHNIKTNILEMINVIF